MDLGDDGRIGFCVSCGKPVRKAAQTQQSEFAQSTTVADKRIRRSTRRSGKPLFITLLVLVVTTAAIIIIVLNNENYTGNQPLSAMFPESMYTLLIHSIEVHQVDDEVHLRRFERGNEIGHVVIKGYLYYFWTISNDRMKAVITISDVERELIDHSSNIALYYFDGSLHRIDSIHMWFRLSGTGNAVVYSKPNGDNFDLILWKDGYATTLVEDRMIGDMFCISPSGDAVGYYYYDDTLDSTAHFTPRGYVWNGNHIELGIGTMPRAVSDSAQYVYFYKQNDILRDNFYVQTNLNPHTTVDLGEGDFTLNANFSSDFSQVVYTPGDGRFFISVNGGERKELHNDIRMWHNLNPLDHVRNRDSFANTFFSGDTIVYIDGNFDSHVIATNTNAAFLMEDWKTLFYQKNGSIYRVTGIENNLVHEHIVSGVAKRAFIPTRDGSAIFYAVNEGSTTSLYYMEIGNEPVLVSNKINLSDVPGYNIEVYESIFEIFDGRVMYYIENGRIYYSDGNIIEQVLGIDDNITFIRAGLFSVSAYRRVIGDNLYVYHSSDGIHFIRLN